MVALHDGEVGVNGLRWGAAARAGAVGRVRVRVRGRGGRLRGRGRGAAGQGGAGCSSVAPSSQKRSKVLSMT
jgi:hypothetical protein